MVITEDKSAHSHASHIVIFQAIFHVLALLCAIRHLGDDVRGGTNHWSWHREDCERRGGTVFTFYHWALIFRRTYVFMVVNLFTFYTTTVHSISLNFHEAVTWTSVAFDFWKISLALHKSGQKYPYNQQMASLLCNMNLSIFLVKLGWNPETKCSKY